MQAVDRPVIVVPRIYADSLVDATDPHSLSYLKDLTTTLAPDCPIVYCGNDIVAHRIGGDASAILQIAVCLFGIISMPMIIVRAVCLSGRGADPWGHQIFCSIQLA